MPEDLAQPLQKWRKVEIEDFSYADEREQEILRQIAEKLLDAGYKEDEIRNMLFAGIDMNGLREDTFGDRRKTWALTFPQYLKEAQMHDEKGHGDLVYTPRGFGEDANADNYGIVVLNGESFEFKPEDEEAPWHLKPGNTFDEACLMVCPVKSED